MVVQDQDQWVGSSGADQSSSHSKHGQEAERIKEKTQNEAMRKKVMSVES